MSEGAQVEVLPLSWQGCICTLLCLEDLLVTFTLPISWPTEHLSGRFSGLAQLAGMRFWVEGAEWDVACNCGQELGCLILLVWSDIDAIVNPTLRPYTTPTEHSAWKMKYFRWMSF